LTPNTKAEAPNDVIYFSSPAMSPAYVRTPSSAPCSQQSRFLIRSFFYVLNKKKRYAKRHYV